MYKKTNKEVYDFIVQYIEENGKSPSTFDIQEFIGCRVPSTASHRLKALEAEGLITLTPCQHRSIRLTK